MASRWAPVGLGKGKVSNAGFGVYRRPSRANDALRDAVGQMEAFLGADGPEAS